MPIGVEVARQVQRKKEQDPRWDDRSEEGVFHIVSADGTRYWVKQWYKMHDKAKGIKATENASPCSPYWHKLKYYEYQLIHEAFPDHTIELVSCYDERISKTGASEYAFNIFSGQPATVSVEVTGDPVLSTQRNEALKRAYAVLLAKIIIDQPKKPVFPQMETNSRCGNAKNIR